MMESEWEVILRSWIKPLGESEESRCENAERLIREAIRESDQLRNRDIEVFAQGSYRNNTNIPQESDVDVCVVCKDSFYYDLSHVSHLDPASLGISSGLATYTFRQFKDDVQIALENKFGKKGVGPGDKAIKLHANSYRVVADVVAAFQNRVYYLNPQTFRHYHIEGTAFVTDKGKFIQNFPKQHTFNGIEKNKLTGYRYKYLTRCLKSLKHLMISDGIRAAEPIPSFLIECLVYNAPNHLFSMPNYYSTLREVLVYLFNNTMNDSACEGWFEVNDIKFLFHTTQPWTRLESHQFLSAAWNYIGYS